MTSRPYLVVALALSASPAAAQIPSTDIFLVPIHGTEVGVPRRVTDREGYDNQPSFLPDGTALVYASRRGDSTDIYRYDVQTGEERLVVDTPENEYSPTPIPGRDAISVVRDFGNERQELWSYPLKGGEPKALLPAVNPVGYHAWVDGEHAMLFVLGEPHTLQIASVGPDAGKVVAESPGRVLAHIPGRSEMSYVDKSDGTWWLTAFDPATETSHRLTATRDGHEDYAWAPDGSVWMGDGSRLFRWREGGDWREVCDLERYGVLDITRLTFAPHGALLALVAARPPSELTDAYRPQADRILEAALADTEGWEKLEHLAVEIGPRLSGSKGLERAIEWASARMQTEGLVGRKQKAMVPHWVRGKESAWMLAPLERPLRILGLGNSVGTPPGGITAPVVVVRDFDELDALDREDVEGKIVLYASEWRGYGYTVQFRGRGASRAAALGAVAALVRSATGNSLATPHTGALNYDDDHPKIPAAAVTPEDAMWMLGLARRGIEIKVRLEMEAQMLEDAESYNVIAEIPGSENPEEVVVMGGHYDSWDVGQGVHDDGAACIAAWQALRIVSQLGLRPRRTLRVVLWTNEENGTRGARAYRAALSDEEVANHVAAMEMDGGCETPVGWGFSLSGKSSKGDDPAYEAARDRLVQIGRLLEGIAAAEVGRGGGGVDIGPLMRSGVPGLGLHTVGEHYFDWHHTDADTIDKVDVEDFRKAIAVLAVTGFVLADMPERLVPAAN